MIKKILAISGILAAIAVFIRGSVIIGLFLGILPGLILAVAPTVFLYTAAFALLRTVLRNRLRMRLGSPSMRRLRGSRWRRPLRWRRPPPSRASGLSRRQPGTM
jgi:hypothetical protein